MYIVRRTFRDRCGVLPAGSVVEPADVVRFRYRLQEGHIVEVTEQNFDKYADFFDKRFGVELVLENGVVKLGAYALGKGPVEVSVDSIKEAKEIVKAKSTTVAKAKAVSK